MEVSNETSDIIQWCKVCLRMEGKGKHKHITGLDIVGVIRTHSRYCELTHVP